MLPFQFLHQFLRIKSITFPDIRGLRGRFLHIVQTLVFGIHITGLLCFMVLSAVVMIVVTSVALILPSKALAMLVLYRKKGRIMLGYQL